MLVCFSGSAFADGPTGAVGPERTELMSPKCSADVPGMSPNVYECLQMRTFKGGGGVAAVALRRRAEDEADARHMDDDVARLGRGAADRALVAAHQNDLADDRLGRAVFCLHADPAAELRRALERLRLARRFGRRGLGDRERLFAADRRARALAD